MKMSPLAGASDDAVTFTTSSVSLTESPKWNQTFEMDVAQGDELLYMRMYECRHNTKGQTIGKVSLFYCRDSFSAHAHPDRIT